MEMIFFLTLCVLSVSMAEEAPDLEDIDPMLRYRDWRPGDMFPSTEIADIDNALDDVLEYSESLFVGCAIAIANVGDKNLVFPRWHTQQGNIHTVPYDIIEPGETSLLLFNRDIIDYTGSYGVVSYAVEGTVFQTALMWMIPIAPGYRNSFSPKVYQNFYHPDSDMYNQMYDYTGRWNEGGWQSRSEFGIVMKGQMTTKGLISTQAKIILTVDNSNYSFKDGPSNHGYCYGVVPFANCRRECSPFGTCATGEGCLFDSDCDGSQLECKRGCDL